MKRMIRNGAARMLPIIALMLALALDLSAQRRVTPVVPLEPGTAPKKEKKEDFDRSRLVEKSDAQGNIILVDTVSGTEFIDSTLMKAPPKMEYPLLHEVIVGLNFWDGAMRVFGQKYGLADVWGEVSLHNRYFPYFAFGMGNCNDTPAGKNYTFKTPTAPYFKIGASYNFLYNSNPDYKLQMGLRYGFTTYKWNLEDVTVDEGYWGDPSHFSLMNQKHTAGYLEVTLGLKVQIIKQFSLGWHIVYHSILHETTNPNGQPMYIPGYGKRSSAITGNFSLIYTIPLSKKPTPIPDTL
jgi:hypothetical protein